MAGIVTVAPPALVCGLSGWFTPHGIRYHEDVRGLDKIRTGDWTALLAHANAIAFFTRPEPAPAPPGARIFHLRITSGDRSRELAINDPFEAPELAMLIRLTRRALRDRQVLTPETMTDEDEARIVASLPTEEEIRTGRFAWE